jgi:hypothetical protein
MTWADVFPVIMWLLLIVAGLMMVVHGWRR